MTCGASAGHVSLMLFPRGLLFVLWASLACPSLPLPQVGMIIYVHMWTGATFDLRVNRSDTIEVVKSRIQLQEGIPPDMIRLTFACQLLEDTYTLSHYDIRHESAVHLLLRLRGGALVQRPAAAVPSAAQPPPQPAPPAGGPDAAPPPPAAPPPMRGAPKRRIPGLLHPREYSVHEATYPTLEEAKLAVGIGRRITGRCARMICHKPRTSPNLVFLYCQRHDMRPASEESCPYRGLLKQHGDAWHVCRTPNGKHDASIKTPVGTNGFYPVPFGPSRVSRPSPRFPVVRSIERSIMKPRVISIVLPIVISIVRLLVGTTGRSIVKSVVRSMVRSIVRSIVSSIKGVHWCPVGVSVPRPRRGGGFVG